MELNALARMEMGTSEEFIDEGNEFTGGETAVVWSANDGHAIPENANNRHRSLVKCHVLPFVGADMLDGSAITRLRSISPALCKLRDGGNIVRPGDLVSHEGNEFAVVKCEPAEGHLSKHTDFYLEGGPLVRFNKIQFSAWGPIETDDIFSKYVAPYFQGDFAPYGTKGSTRVRFFYAGMVVQVGDSFMQVEATEPEGLGVVAAHTEIFAVREHPVVFEKVHVVPIQESLPRAYDFDVFHDYLKPYLKQHQYRKFAQNDFFTFQGIQFKLIACDPCTARGLIGAKTTIYCDGAISLSLMNSFSQEELRIVANMSPTMQLMVLSQVRASREQDNAAQSRGLFEETISAVEGFTWPPKADNDQKQCMVCLTDFSDGMKCRRLPCAHVFHQRCVDEWLRRCTDCPICKSNVDRAIRQY
eukprot:TRINITY_DN9684_c0_g3_i1.p1 TRINITY_DN9684_c0_g3~~TRINITY_DN9684_c0_g3_i1.p1  ORF type:complete len:454 (+),score=56.09 TRINITY_DN9684_c0_g3_i1:119-1363(+)